MSFEWIALNGCAICQAMQGYYEEEPARPHPNCDCEIFDEGRTVGERGEEFLYYTDEEPIGFTSTWRVWVVCPDGIEHSDYVEIFNSNEASLYWAGHPEDIEGYTAYIEEFNAAIDGAIAAAQDEIEEIECTTFSVPHPDP